MSYSTAATKHEEQPAVIHSSNTAAHSLHFLEAQAFWHCSKYHLGVVHETSAEALDLLIGSDCTEGDLPKALLVEGAVCDPAHHVSFPPDDGHGAVPPI